MNLLRPLGAPLGPTADRVSFDDVIRTGAPTVGGIGPVGVVSGRRLVPVRVPVRRDDGLRYVLTVLMAPNAVSGILREAVAPQAWIGSVIDGKGDIIARAVDENVSQAQPAAADARTAIARAPERSYRERTPDGVDSDVIYREVPGTRGWTVHFAIPSAFLERPVRQGLSFLGGGVLASLVLAGILTALVARELTERRREQQALADAELALSQERRAIAVEAAELGVWRWSIDDDMVTASPRFQSLLNLPPGQCEGASVRWPAARVIDAIHPDDRAAVTRALERARK